MTYFLAQSRRIQWLGEKLPNFPSELEIIIDFAPEDSFGVRGSAPRTTIKLGTRAQINLDANEGVTFIEGELIDELSCEFQVNELSGMWRGNVLTIIVLVSSMEDVRRIILSANHMLPATLSFHLKIFVWIRKFGAQIDNCRFNVEAVDNRSHFMVASTEINQSYSIEAAQDWVSLGAHSRRLVVAMYYFRQALRLEAIQPDTQSMTAEVVLNLCKAVEAIFPGSRDAIRQRAMKIGVNLELLEKRIIPLLLIRNEFDVAHAALTPLQTGQKVSLEEFTSSATQHVHQLLSFVVKGERDGMIKFPQISEDLDKYKERLLSRIAQYTAD